MRRLPAVAAIALLAALTACALAAAAPTGATAAGDRLVADHEPFDAGTGGAVEELPGRIAHAASPSASGSSGSGAGGGGSSGTASGADEAAISGTASGAIQGGGNASRRASSGGARNETNASESVDPAAVRAALIDGDRLVAPCAAEPPGWHWEWTGTGERPNRTPGAWNGADPTADGTADGTVDGTVDSTADGTGSGTTDDTVNGTANGTASGTENGAVNGTANGTGNGTADGNRTLADGRTTAEQWTLVRNDTESSANASVVGRVDGTWYDARLSIDDSDRLTRAELRTLVERTAARIEALRCLDFESVPRVQVVQRATMTARQQTELAARSPARDQYDDARLEAALLVPTEEDPTAARIRTRTGAVRASYDPEYDVVTLLGDSGNGTIDASALDEPTLAHELVHALQDQRLNLSSLDSRRTDRAFAEAAFVEGDAVVIERWFEGRCGSDGWNEPCLDASPPRSNTDSVPGLNLLLFQPYNDGPGLVERRFERGGWSAVDALYANPPRSTAEVLFPTSYDDYDPDPVRVPLSGGGGWELLRPPGGPTTDSLGAATVAATLMAPTFESGTDPIYQPQSLQQTGTRTGLDRHQVYDYRVDGARDWAGDRLVVYRRDGDLASVWRSAWQSRDAASQFEHRYVQLLERRGARPHGRLPDVYRFRDASEFDGAVYVDVDGRSVTVVHGPDVAALRDVHPDVPRPVPGGREGAAPAPSSPTEVSGDALSGLTALAALVAALVGIALRGRTGSE